MNNPLQYPTRIAVAVFNEYCTRTVTGPQTPNSSEHSPTGS